MKKVKFESFGTLLTKNEMKLINGGYGDACNGSVSCAQTGECISACICNSMNFKCE